MIAWRQWFLRAVMVFGLSWLLPGLALAHPPLPDLTDDEQAWIAAHREKVFSVGYDPDGGKDVFEFQGRRQGALPDLLADMQRQLGLRFVLDHVSGWDDAYQRFASGQADILFGANPTPEREKIMRFTRPAWRYPYVVLARRDAVAHTLGDLDGRRVGFIANDFVAEQIPREYRNIQYQAVFYRDQDDALKALRDGKIDGMVTSGGGIEHDYLYRFPQLLIIATLSSITSDMTFAVHRNRDVLAALIDKYLVQRLAEVQRIT